MEAETMSTTERLDRAGHRGRIAGKADADNYIDATPVALRSRNDCPSPLSGEWAGESIKELLGDLFGERPAIRAGNDEVLNAYDDLQYRIENAYENAYTESWFAVLEEAEEAEGTTEAEFGDLLATLLADSDEIEGVSTFSDVGVMTMNEGLVVRLYNGTEFQVTIVQSRTP
jgi:hypothetical protein